MTTFTLSVSSANSGTTAGTWGDIALVFSGTAGPGTSASTTGTGTATVTVTTTQDHSAIAVIALDWIPADGSSRAWLTLNGTTPTAGNGLEQVYFNNGDYAVYCAYWPDAGTAGAKTVGLSAPTGMKYTIIATEVLGTLGAAGPAAALAASFTLNARPPWTGAGAVLPVTASVTANSLGYALQQAALPAGLSLAGGGITLGAGATLAAGIQVLAAVTGWTFTGTVPLTYPQYLGTGGALTAVPGEFTNVISPASGYPWDLGVPPPDGRWVSPSSGPEPVRLDAVRLPDMRAKAPLRSRRAQHGQRSRSAYATMGARR